MYTTKSIEGRELSLGGDMVTTDHFGNDCRIVLLNVPGDITLLWSAERGLPCVSPPGSFPHPLRGVNTPTFAQHPPASGGKEGERGTGGRGKGKGRGKGEGRDPQGLVDTPCSKS